MTTPVPDPRYPRAGDPIHLIGQEWLEHGYETFNYEEPPEPCIIDGTPMNSCTDATHKHFYGGSNG